VIVVAVRRNGSAFRVVPVDRSSSARQAPFSQVWR
jgi:hypothetical protein